LQVEPQTGTCGKRSASCGSESWWSIEMEHFAEFLHVLVGV
jgi:hypothetical protein